MSINNLIKLSGEKTIDLRLGAALVDFLILFITSHSLLSALKLTGTAYFIVIFSLLEIVYFVCLETSTGYTIGKFIFRVRVINSNFEKPQAIQSLIRAVLWLIEVNPIIVIIPLIVYFITQKNSTKQRFGDKLAGTFVIKSKCLKQYKNIQSMDYNEYKNKDNEIKTKLPKHYIDQGGSLNNIKLKRKLRIVGINNMNYENLIEQVNNGEKFVMYTYSIFILVLSLNGTSSIYFGKKNLRTIFARIRYIIFSSLTLILTGLFFLFSDSSFVNFSSLNAPAIIFLILVLICILIPIPSIITNLLGGIDVTESTINYIEGERADNLNTINTYYNM